MKEIMNYKEFKNHYDKINEKETKKHWSYLANYTWVDFYKWPNKIDFLDKFIKVFKDYPSLEILVDENIWFIVIWDGMFIWENFLDDCIKTKRYWKEAYYFYYEEFEDYMNNQKK